MRIIYHFLIDLVICYIGMLPYNYKASNWHCHKNFKLDEILQRLNVKNVDINK